VLKNHHVLDVMVHIDPEDDMQAKPNAHLPGRPKLLAHLAERLGDTGLAEHRVVLHYLDGMVDAEIYMASQLALPASELQKRCDELVQDDKFFRLVQVHLNHAQN
jgi:hypothetical protein